ncbi:MAG: DUF3830 family protein [Lewinellaceae bacterium]|jgi:hypothetical protein|nr:DUF3830 family protein [Lewinellaceae bacterium]
MDFKATTKEGKAIRFQLYVDAAPATAEAFLKVLPFSAMFYHARVSGEEIWISDAPELDVIQENCSVFAEPGEIVIGVKNPARNRIARCIGIFYGKGQLLDCGNIFGKVLAEDLPVLKTLGDSIWRNGGQELIFERM